jgi:hypothetical protein
LPPDAAWTAAATGALVSITRTADELSVVCPQDDAPPGARVEGGWRALKLQGPILFAEVGVLSTLAGALAGAGLSLFAVSTYDTDYVLVKERDLAAALDALRMAGCEIV